jgi:hypothetical protein
MRAVGSAVFCEPCLAAKLDAAGAVSASGYSYSDPAPGGAAASAYASAASSAEPYVVSGILPPKPLSGVPNPVLAGLLGLIPGVGAMYNEQYAKGIVHLVVFAILVSLVDNNGIFGLFVAGWVCYMAIEAHHTARARRDGLPLPNPFGLNDLGERLGFGKSWGAPQQHPFAGSTAAPGAVPVDPYQPPAAGYAPPAGNPYVSGAVPQNWAGGWNQPPTQPYGQAYGQVPSWESYAAPVPPPIGQVPLDSQVPYPGNRFPAGALWLIGFGALFLIGNVGWFHGFPTRLLLPFLLIGFGVFIFVRKMTSFGGGLTSDGTASYRLRVFRALRASVWVALVGFLFFLDEFNILSWAHSWPLFIILAGVMTVLERAAYSAAVAAGPPPFDPAYGAGYYPPASVSPSSPSATAEPTPTAFSSTHENVADRKEGE